MAETKRKTYTIRELCDRYWDGKQASDTPPMDVSKDGKPPPQPTSYPSEEFEPGLLFIMAFANSVVVDTSDGLVMVDVGNWGNTNIMFNTVRKYSNKRLHTAIYTHGHADHVFGVSKYEKENPGDRVTVVAHKNLPKRFERYNLTNGYNGIINWRQFRLKKPEWPSDFRYPDLLYEESVTLSVGGVRFECYHAKGETDDATWVYIPKYEALCTGDFFIWASPNCGNPQKVQRYPREWAEALRKMQGKRAKYLFPGHGVPIVGYERVDQALRETAEYLESLVKQTLELMNKGRTLDEIIFEVKPPAGLTNRPYLWPIYDEPEFVVRNIWRLYGGWWDFDFASLKPASRKAQALELATLSGGALALVERGEKLSLSQDDMQRRLACHLAEIARLAVDNDSKYTADDKITVHKKRVKIYENRAKKETSYMATGIYRGAVLQSNEAIKKLEKPKAKL